MTAARTAARTVAEVDPAVIARCALLGVAVGCRSQLGTAVVALRAHARPRVGSDPWPLSLAASSRALPVSGVAALGELVGDKLPQTPSRTAKAGLVGRLVGGATVGAQLAQLLTGRNPSRLVPLAGAVAGVLGATVGTYGGHALRARAGRVSGLPDPVVAVAEDALALGMALLATSA